MRTIVCHHCGRRVRSNKKLKHLVQCYCGNTECQSYRKLTFDRNKYNNNQEFRIRKLEKVREKRKRQQGQSNPQYYSDYQRAYRAAHPQYVIGNREKQRERYARKKDKTSLTTKIVNPDALMLERIEMLPFTDKKPLFVRLL
ncbi:MAG: hypothetical protein WC599_00780 [Bacteroidales bacterium]